MTVTTTEILPEHLKIKSMFSMIEITMEISGPVSIIENTRNGGFRYLTYSPLKVSAEDAETEAMIADEQES